MEDKNLRYATSRINRVEFEQIIGQPFEDNPMLKAQRVKSAAEEWYEEGLLKGLERGREEGREEVRKKRLEEGRQVGYEEGLLIGQIRTLQEVFDLPVTPETDLKTLSIEPLQSLLQKVRASARRAPKS